MDKLVAPIEEQGNEKESVNLITTTDLNFEPLDLSNRETAKTESSFEETPSSELKVLPTHLKYAHLGDDNTLLVVISFLLSQANEELLLQVLKKYIRAIGWMLTDI